LTVISVPPASSSAPYQPVALVWLTLLVAAVAVVEAALSPVGFGTEGDSLLLL
jgi:hypothetical protein